MKQLVAFHRFHFYYIFYYEKQGNNLSTPTPRNVSNSVNLTLLDPTIKQDILILFGFVYLDTKSESTYSTTIREMEDLQKLGFLHVVLVTKHNSYKNPILR